MFRVLFNIRHFVWPLLLLALFLLIIFDFLLLPYRLHLLFFGETSDQLSKAKKKKNSSGAFFSLAETETMNMDQNFHFLFLPHPFA